MLVLNSDISQEQFDTFCQGSKVGCIPEGHVGTGGIPFMEVHGTRQDLHDLITAHPGLVDFVEPDLPTHLIPELPVDVQDNTMSIAAAASWGLYKVGVAKATNKGKGVHVYVADTGVRTTHSDFGGRAIPTLEYISTSPKVCHGSTSCAQDVHGHGTHCAGTVGGTTYGVAPEATIHGVKVLSNSGSGSLSWIVGAIDWIATQGQRPAVVSMSLGGSGRSAAYTRAIDTASNNGVTVVVAAGNENSDACNFSPAFVPSAITVGSTDSRDARSSFSNYGSCLQIYAPGSNIKSAGHRTDLQSATMSGTSMACPHVAGAAALVLETNPNMKSDQILSTMLSKAVSNRISGVKSTCPNKLLYVGGDSGPAPGPAPTPAPAPAPGTGTCPSFAVYRTPDADGDCVCPVNTWCSTTPSYTWDCPYSGGIGGRTGRYFLGTCTACVCYQAR
jgi:subtilisin family serine protease